jgi:hypothetical protein
MRAFITTILLAGSLFAAAQPPTKKASKEPDFKNQGEAEDYWMRKIFANEYIPQTFERYKGPITRNGQYYSYGNWVLKIETNVKEWLSIFANGTVYPGIAQSNNTSINASSAKADTSIISAIEEIHFPTLSPTRKRLRYWLFSKVFGSWIANPTIYFIELTNDNSTKDTDLPTFLNGSRLSFYRRGWLII